MKRTKNNDNKLIIKHILTFLFLFLIYHFPEFLQQHYQKPLLLLFETVMLVFVITAFFVGRRNHNNGLKTFGLISFRQHKGNLLKGIIIGFSLFAIAGFIPVWLNWSEISIHFGWKHILFQTILFSLGTLLPSLSEDILTRGLLKAYFPEKWNTSWLILISAIVYVLNHYYRLNKPDVLLYLFILGILLMWSFVATGSLWLTLGIHWGSNIAYQFFTNLTDIDPIKETGLENYLLALSFFIGFIAVFGFYKLNLFKVLKPSSDQNQAPA